MEQRLGRAARLALCAVAALVLAGACRGPRPAPVLLATTTSVDDSGLLEALRSAFAAQTGVELDPFVVGSGKALRMAHEGRVDVVITHEPRGERELWRTRRAVAHRAFLENRFIVVGPPENPAAIPPGATVVDALRAIHARGARFASRADESGTHARELELWRLLGVDPAANPEYRKLGQGMSALLRSANELRAYALTDEATFARFAASLDLVPIATGGDGVRNVYTVTLLRGRAGAVDPSAKTFYEWLLGPSGRRVVASFIDAHGGFRFPEEPERRSDADLR